MKKCVKMVAYRCEEDIIQNLKDAGCDEDTIQIFMDDLQCGEQTKGTLLLQKHRHNLLDTLHQDQKRIDCLDYLLFMLRKAKDSESENNKKPL